MIHPRQSLINKKNPFITPEAPLIIMKVSTVLSLAVAALTSSVVAAKTVVIQELQSPPGPRHSDAILDVIGPPADKNAGTDIGLIWFHNDLAVPDGTLAGGAPMGVQSGHCVEVWVGTALACYFRFELDTPDDLKGTITAEALFDLTDFPAADLTITGGTGDFLGIVGSGKTSLGNLPAQPGGITTFLYTFDYFFTPIKGGGGDK
jgi:hypothetical protein